MIALDTNVLMRYLVQDHPQQSRLASHLLEKLDAQNETCFIGDIVLCELVWVLESCYHFSRKEIADTLTRVLLVAFFSFEEKEDILKATELYRQKKGDFADYLLGLRAVRNGASKVFTFDRALKTAPHFSLII